VAGQGRAAPSVGSALYVLAAAAGAMAGSGVPAVARAAAVAVWGRADRRSGRQAAATGFPVGSRQGRSRLEVTTARYGWALQWAPIDPFPYTAVVGSGLLRML
jgi:hypothetical protein